MDRTGQLPPAAASVSTFCQCMVDNTLDSVHVRRLANSTSYCRSFRSKTHSARLVSSVRTCIIRLSCNGVSTLVCEMSSRKQVLMSEGGCRTIQPKEYGTNNIPDLIYLWISASASPHVFVANRWESPLIIRSGWACHMNEIHAVVLVIRYGSKRKS